MMSDAGFHHSVCAREDLRDAIKASPPHLKMILEAVRDRDIRFALVRQHSGAFTFPVGMPIVLLIGDDYDLCWGPQAFDHDSIERFVRGATSALVVSDMPDPMAYDAAVARAVLSGHHSIIVETSGAFEGEWISLLHTLAPDMPVLVSSLPSKEAKR